jgi:hypothetical protein
MNCNSALHHIRESLRKLSTYLTTEFRLGVEGPMNGIS